MICFSGFIRLSHSRSFVVKKLLHFYMLLLLTLLPSFLWLIWMKKKDNLQHSFLLIRPIDCWWRGSSNIWRNGQNLGIPMSWSLPLLLFIFLWFWMILRIYVICVNVVYRFWQQFPFHKYILPNLFLLVLTKRDIIKNSFNC